jgi:FAD/FMN-containing dehydrogenase
MRTLYATDASSYREMPLAVAIPQTEYNLKALIQFAETHKKLGLFHLRTAGKLRWPDKWWIMAFW